MHLMENTSCCLLSLCQFLNGLFGNDFRQEPWMVHATDNLVYVPADKITEVSPDEVAAGDWRNKIVPSPSGNEMLEIQLIDLL
jgi:hypothetical protein